MQSCKKDNWTCSVMLHALCKETQCKTNFGHKPHQKQGFNRVVIVVAPFYHVK